MILNLNKNTISYFFVNQMNWKDEAVTFTEVVVIVKPEGNRDLKNMVPVQSVL